MRALATLAAIALFTGCKSNATFDPVADAGPDRVVAIGHETLLSGTGSDADGVVTDFEWTLVGAPDGSAATLQSGGSDASIQPDVQGIYDLGLVVVDDDGRRSAMDLVSVHATSGNLPPEALISSDGPFGIGLELSLDGSASTDPEGDALSFHWSVQIAPQTSTAEVLGSPDSPLAGFTPDTAGFYVLGLEVDDGLQRSTRADLAFSATLNPNDPPVAVCPGPLEGELGEVLSLVGSASFDPDGDPLSYGWSLTSRPGGSTADIVDPDLEVASFTPDVDGVWYVDLIVTDGQVDSEPCTFTIKGGEGGGNNPPVADAGPDLTVGVGEVAELDGTGSYDPDGDPLTASWRFTLLPGASALGDADISDADQLSARFVPDVEGEYRLQIQVCDPEPLCETNTQVTKVLSAGNNAPVSDAGVDQTVTLGDAVVTDGSGSYDPDGDAITYRWALDSVPSGSTLTNASWSDRYTVTSSFTPDVEGDYSVKLVVDDGALDDKDWMTVTVSTGTTNTPPVADAGPDASAALGATVTMDGSGSYDPDGDPITYRWAFQSLPSGSALSSGDIVDRYTTSGSFDPDVVGDYELKLVVDDGTDNDKDYAIITVSNTNTAPIADAGSDVDGGCALETVKLDGSGSSDADGDTLTYRWRFDSVPTGSALVNSDITNRYGRKPSFTPDVFGTYTLDLKVDDGVDSDSDTVDVVFDNDDAVLVMHMDDGSGTTVVDDGPNGLDGTATNGDWTGAVHFGGLDFDGSELVTVPDDGSLDFTDEFSIELWVQAAGSAASYEVLVMKPSGTSYAYSFWRYGDETVAFYGLNSAGSYNYVWATGASIGDGEWHHYVVNGDSSVVDIWEDGALLGSTSVTSGLASSTDDLELGGWSAYSGYYRFNGVMDELILRDAVLSKAEIAARYADSAQFCTGDEDTTAPTASISSPADGSSSDWPYVAIEGTADDESAIVSLSVNGNEAAATSANYGTWVAYVDLTSGSNTLTVSVEDIAGNIDTNADSITVTYSGDCYGDQDLVLTFDEDQGGTAYDATSNANDGSESGTDRVIGAFGNAAVFDGSADITVPHSGKFSSSARFTADFWYRSDSTAAQEVIFHKGTFNYGCAGLGDDLYCAVMDTAGDTHTAVAYGVNDGAWHHVAVVFNTTYLRLYVDGAVQDRVTVGVAAATNTDDLYFGGYQGVSGYEWTGDLDHFRFDDKDAWTAAEVSAAYTADEQCLISDNLAASGSATASSQASANYAADSVIDGDMAEDDYSDESYWLMTASATGWVEVDLGGMVGVTRLRWVNTHHGPRYTAGAEDFEIYASTTGAFTGEEELVSSGTGDLETDLRYHQIDLTSPVPATYLRFYVDSYHSLYGGLNELEIYGVE